MNRLIDPGAVFAGWVGIGAAVVLAMAFELILPLQILVLVLALPLGALIGAYANNRSARRRPRGRVMANALWAGLVTAVALTVFYVGVRLVFFYADSGVRADGTRLDCRPGPACTYARLIDQGRATEMAEQGIDDAIEFEQAYLRELAVIGLALSGLTVGGAAIAGGVRAAGSRSWAPAASVSAPGR